MNKRKVTHQGNRSTVFFPSLNRQKEMEELSFDCESEDALLVMTRDSVLNAHVQTIDTNMLKTNFVSVEPINVLLAIISRMFNSHQ